MPTISELWQQNKQYLLEKKLQQVLSFCGDGKLKDGNDTSAQFRDYLGLVPTSVLRSYAQECLQDSFQDSGLALQDIVNQIGMRLGFEVKPGVYRGSSTIIGYDGLWKAVDGHLLLIEVKTTDAYRINLDTIVEYRKKLAANGVLEVEKTSILIVVGRQDTGDLEAQIRGSRNAWEIRLISTDSLLVLLSLKEKLDDAQTIHRINEILKPQEFTRIDKLIDIMFTTAKDIEQDEEEEEEEELDYAEKSENKESKKKFTPVNFHQDCADRIEKKLGAVLVRQSKSAYVSERENIAIILTVSKAHAAGSHRKYWFAFHPYYKDFLEKYEKPYIAFGCGSKDLIALVPFAVFKPCIDDLWFTKREDKLYWHVVIHEKSGKLEWQLPKKDSFLSLNDYILKDT
ncbi:MAG: hypothetical protein V2A69_11205 [Pseudomonadota bacterium]